MDSILKINENRKTPIQNIPGFTQTERGQEILGPVDGPLETPIDEIGPGPLYIDAEEIIKDLTAGTEEVVAKVSQRAHLNTLSVQDDQSPSDAPTLPVDRRDFLKLFGASTVALAASCVRRPLEKAIPFVNQPVDQAVGDAVNYATTCGECSSGCGIVVKTISGFPTKIEGNAQHPVSQGSTCAVGQASLQGLYHPERQKTPIVKRGNRTDTQSWDDVYELLAAQIKNKTKKVAIFTGGSTGHQEEFLGQFLKQIGGSADDVYSYDANGLYAAVSQAHKIAFGQSGIPRADLRQAQIIVGLGSDFLDIGTSNVFMSKNFAAARSIRDKQMAKFIQFESFMTQTGARADHREVILANSELVAALALLDSVVKHAPKASQESLNGARKILAAQSTLVAQAAEITGVKKEVFDQLAQEITEKQSVVFAGSTSIDENATNLQLVAIAINAVLGAYEKTLFFNRGWMNTPVRPGDAQRFIQNASQYEIVFFIDTNPIFSLPKSWNFDEVLKKIPVVVSMQPFPCEVDRYAHYVLNTHHFLESWGDEQPVAGFWSPRQPAVRPTTDSRQAEDVFLWIAAHLKKPMGHEDYRDFVRSKWKVIHQQQVSQGSETPSDFDLFFDAILRRGFVGKLATRNTSLQDFSAQIKPQTKLFSKDLKLVVPMSPRLGDGRGAHKPLLQEIGDGLTTIAWDSWVAMNPETAKDLGFRRNDLLKVETESGSLEVALYPQPGLASNVAVIYRGNGHDTAAGTIAGGVGVNPNQLIPMGHDSGSMEPSYSGVNVKLSKTGKIYMLAAMQKSHDLGNRTDIVKKYSLQEVLELKPRTKTLDDVPNLYPELDAEIPYRWGMSIDLTKCTGCGACMAACATENNVPQVGRDEVLRHRQMHWIRLDRYYEGDLNNPQVTFQPMMCQQCSHAPCEAVCPVIATSHDPEGINAMTYNRCIGTRYCANACPYKVRRFNWWTYKWGVTGSRAVDRNPRALNPDVTVRTRGVMEKCNFCAHRVRQAKFKAKDASRLVQDGELRTACEQVCPSDAIVFGNLKDSNSRAAKLRLDSRAYLALGGDPEKGEFGLKTLPNVSYLAQVGHKAAKPNHTEHHG